MQKTHFEDINLSNGRNYEWYPSQNCSTKTWQRWCEAEVSLFKLTLMWGTLIAWAAPNGMKCCSFDWRTARCHGYVTPPPPPPLLASWSFMVLSCYLHVPERGSNKVHTCVWSNKCGTMVSSQKIPLAQGLQNCCHKIFFQDLISHQSKIKPFLKE